MSSLVLESFSVRGKFHLYLPIDVGQILTIMSQVSSPKRCRQQIKIPIPLLNCGNDLFWICLISLVY